MTDIKPSNVFGVLSDESRLRIVRMLIASEAEVTAGQLAEALNVPPSHISRHLQLLNSSGLIVTRRNGKTKLVRVSSKDNYQKALYTAVLSMPDESGIYAKDVELLLKLTESNVE